MGNTKHQQLQRLVALIFGLFLFGALLQSTAMAAAGDQGFAPERRVLDESGGTIPFTTITLTITKVVMGATPVADWEFNGAPDLGDFTIPPAGGVGVLTANAQTNYTITEVVKPGYFLTVDCDAAQWQAVENGVLIVGASTDVSCTFTNTQYANVMVVKKATPQSKQTFDFYTSGDDVFTLIDDGTNLTNTQALTQVIPGQFSVTEHLQPGWDTTSKCDYEDGGSSATGNNQIDLTMTPGASALCVFTNTMNTITVIKQASPESGQVFGFHYIGLPGPGASSIAGGGIGHQGVFQLTDDGSGVGQSYVITQARAGYSYIVSELTPPGWKLNSLSCVDNNGASAGDVSLASGFVELDIASGQQYTCTFGNLGPTIALTKTVGVSPGGCATSSQTAVFAGTKVYYCFTVQNTGPVTLTKHSLQDSVLGQVLSSFAYTLTPGASVSITRAHTATVAVTNIATWTASAVLAPSLGAASGDAAIPSPVTVTATATASATVTVTPKQPGVELRKTVGVDAAVCSAYSDIIVPSGTTVYYCYTVTNTGNITLPLHTLTDNKLGNLLVGFPYNLGPGQSVSSVAAGAVISAVIAANTTNVGVWTAGVPGGGSVSDTASATVRVGKAGVSVIKTVSKNAIGCGGVSTLNVLAGEQVYFCVTVRNTGDFTFTYHMIDDPLLNFKTAIPYVLKPGDEVEITRDIAPQLGPITVDAPITNTVTFTSSTHAPNLGDVQAAAAQPVVVVASATGVALVKVQVPTALEESPEPDATLSRRLYLPVINR